MPDNRDVTIVKKKKRYIILRIVIFILVVHLILVLSECTRTKEESFTQLFPSVTIKQVDEEFEDCNEVEFQFNNSWEGWNQEIDNQISPSLRITNLEGKKGVFVVNFAFFDEVLYHFNDYKGINYEKVRDELPWKVASMHLNDVQKEISAYSSVVLRPYVQKKDPTAIYWTYADIQPPKYPNCTGKKRIKTVNETVMINTTVWRNVSETETWWQILVEYIKK